jgi:hypothetical protein
MIIAGRACADAANDGYTICLLPNETLTLNQFQGFRSRHCDQRFFQGTRA